MTCCERQGFNCNQGRDCPARYTEEPEQGEWWERPTNLAILIVMAVFLWGLLATVIG